MWKSAASELVELAVANIPIATAIGRTAKSRIGTRRRAAVIVLDLGAGRVDGSATAARRLRTKLAERERERDEREDAGGLPWRAVERAVADPETDGNQPHGVEPWTRERERDEQEDEEVTPHDRREDERGRDRKAEAAAAPGERQDGRARARR